MSIWRVILPAPSSFPCTLCSFLTRSVLLAHGPLVRRLFVVALDRDSFQMVFSVNPTRSHPHRHTCTYTLLFWGSKRGVYCKRKGLCHPVSVLTRQRPQRVGVAGLALNLSIVLAVHARLGGRSWLLAAPDSCCPMSWAASLSGGSISSVRFLRRSGAGIP
jgi:hypothetical protein